MGKLRWKVSLFRSKVRHYRRRGRLIGLLPKRGVGAEIGVFRGKFTRRLLWTAKPETLFLIDPWHAIEQEGAAYGKTQDEMDAMCNDVQRRYARSERVQLMRRRSIDAIPRLRELDWAYVDGDHTYEGVIGDLRGLWPIIRPGGALAGDDYGVKGWWDDGVTRAVDQFSGEVGCRPTIIGSQFLLRKPEDHRGGNGAISEDRPRRAKGEAAIRVQ